mmetsp:Transcript_27480/g.80195  ORF Transcript_27480/g.80195 Transcript_27480/m.80195 type:complete len:358 (+) Transcript_27480:1062-2135(+)
MAFHTILVFEGPNRRNAVVCQVELLETREPCESEHLAPGREPDIGEIQVSESKELLDRGEACWVLQHSGTCLGFFLVFCLGPREVFARGCGASTKNLLNVTQIIVRERQRLEGWERLLKQGDVGPTGDAAGIEHKDGQIGEGLCVQPRAEGRHEHSVPVDAKCSEERKLLSQLGELLPVGKKVSLEIQQPEVRHHRAGIFTSDANHVISACHPLKHPCLLPGTDLEFTVEFNGEGTAIPRLDIALLHVQLVISGHHLRIHRHVTPLHHLGECLCPFQKLRLRKRPRAVPAGEVPHTLAIGRDAGPIVLASRGVIPLHTKVHLLLVLCRGDAAHVPNGPGKPIIVADPLPDGPWAAPA